MIPISQEAYILLATIYGGILIGFIYDLYKIFRKIFNPKKIATLIQDFLFWLIISVVAFYVLIVSNQGALRFYNFLGFVIGAATYTFFLSEIVTNAILFVLRILRSFFLDLYQLIKYPFVVGLCLIEVPYSYCKSKTKPIYYKTRRYFKLPGRIIKSSKKNINNYFKKK
ncbi:spore cortex biosynthesis protein YabQ [Natronincola peptidivorans]|uniref:Spore cortex biosynthesis protein YabQ n=1 Tax=Natronincola peptidivorans TaxID=426128 RepID=A0A1I0CSZ5_9FIRM|nr:spore cortex biosynthesis protein YabQ [Natronincola peptidivorans]SET22485.1 spore cortex biosynthesis protein YabQ [Natronincola peptidivorans]